MSAGSSIVRIKSIILFDKICQLASKYITFAPTRYVFDVFIKPRFENLVKYQVPENELRTTLGEIFYEIKPIFEDYNMSHLLKEAARVNSPEQTKRLMKLPDFALIEDLLP